MRGDLFGFGDNFFPWRAQSRAPTARDAKTVSPQYPHWVFAGYHRAQISIISSGITINVRRSLRDDVSWPWRGCAGTVHHPRPPVALDRTVADFINRTRPRPKLATRFDGATADAFDVTVSRQTAQLALALTLCGGQSKPAKSGSLSSLSNRRHIVARVYSTRRQAGIGEFGDKVLPPQGNLDDPSFVAHLSQAFQLVPWPLAARHGMHRRHGIVTRPIYVHIYERRLIVARHQGACSHVGGTTRKMWTKRPCLARVSVAPVAGKVFVCHQRQSCASCHMASRPSRVRNDRALKGMRGS